MILVAIISIPIVAAVFSAFSRDNRTPGILTLASATAVLGLSIRTVSMLLSNSGHVVVGVPHWLAVDALSALILLLVALVTFTASIFSIGYMDFEKSGGVRRYHVNFNLFVFSMLAVPLIQEPNLVWVAVELTTLFSVLLVGFAGTRGALEAAWKYVVLTLMGAAIALLGFMVLYWAAHHAGASRYSWGGLAVLSPKMPPVLLKAAFVLILVGFGAKIGLVPLHTWLPDAHSQAPTPVCALLSGVETTVVLYVILRLVPVVAPVQSIHADTWMAVFGLVSVGVAAFLLLAVRDYKRLFAFSTVEHMGIILVAVGLGGTAARESALIQALAHSVTKSFCFYAAGSVLLLAGTTKIASIKGLMKRSPVAGAALLFGGLAIAGAPPFAVFLGEFSIIRTGIAKGEYLVTGLLVLFIAIAFFAIMNHVSRMVFGAADDAEKALEAPRPLPNICVAALLLAVVPVALFGVYIPEPLGNLITLAAAALGHGG